MCDGHAGCSWVVAITSGWPGARLDGGATVAGQAQQVHGGFRRVTLQPTAAGRKLVTMRTSAFDVEGR